MSFFVRLNQERDQTYRDAGINIDRGFNAPQVVARYPNGQVRVVRHYGMGRCRTHFQSFSDLQNDLKALIIKPLACVFLSRYHELKCLYELALSAIHLLTLSPELACDHFASCVESFFKSVVYDLLSTWEILQQSVSLAMRMMMTVGHGLAVLTNSVSGVDEPHPYSNQHGFRYT